MQVSYVHAFLTTKTDFTGRETKLQKKKPKTQHRRDKTCLVVNDFWRDVFRGTAQCVRPALHFLREAEIRQLPNTKPHYN